MFTIKIDKKTKNYFIVVSDGDSLEDVLRAIVKASYSLHFPYYGLGFLNKNPAAELPDKKADEYINMENPYLVINMHKCRSKECNTFVYKTGVPLVLYIDAATYETTRGPIIYLFSEMRKKLSQNSSK